MKIGMCLVVGLLVCACHEKRAQLQLMTYRYDFKEISEDSSCHGSTIVRNTGSDTLKILEINASCGCTRASLTKRQLLPADTCRLDFFYTPGIGLGERNEYICLFADTDSLVHLLRIKASVVAVP